MVVTHAAARLSCDGVNLERIMECRPWGMILRANPSSLGGSLASAASASLGPNKPMGLTSVAGRTKGAASVPDARAQRIADASHYPFLTHAPLFDSAVIAFLQGV
jgi:hypothetical protein